MFLLHLNKFAVYFVPKYKKFNTLFAFNVCPANASSRIDLCKIDQMFHQNCQVFFFTIRCYSSAIFYIIFSDLSPGLEANSKVVKSKIKKLTSSFSKSSALRVYKEKYRQKKAGKEIYS